MAPLLVGIIWGTREKLLKGITWGTTIKHSNTSLQQVRWSNSQWFQQQWNHHLQTNIEYESIILHRKTWHKTFQGSDGWLHKFTHHNTFGKIKREAIDTNINAINELPKNKWQNLCEGYMKEHIFNADEMKLFPNAPR